MKILIAGDFVPRHRVLKLFSEGKYTEVLGEVKPIIEQVDFAIANLEAPVIYDKPTPIDKTGPNLSCSENAVEALRWVGFDCVTLANNHFYDQGEQGVAGTLKACEKYAMDYVGAGRNLREAESVYYKEVQGHVLAVVNCCEHEWSIASDKHGGSNPLNPIQQYYAIQEAKRNADYVLVIIHGGTEKYNLPTPRMKETYRFFVEQGADAVVNHHQHCFSGYEVYQGKPIFYGLGNFCFDKTKAKDDKLWEEGFAVTLEFGPIIQFELHPYMQCTESSPSVCFIDEKSDFMQAISHLNEIISDDNLLIKEFQAYAGRNFSRVNSVLVPYKNKWLRALNSRGFFPSCINHKAEKLLYALTRCEAHRDVILEYLKQKYQ